MEITTVRSTPTSEYTKSIKCCCFLWFGWFFRLVRSEIQKDSKYKWKKASTFTTDSCWKHAKCPMIEIPLDFSSGCLFLNANIWFHANTKKSRQDASTPCHLCNSCSLKLLPSIHAKWFFSATNVLLCMHYHYSLRNELEKKWPANRGCSLRTRVCACII